MRTELIQLVDDGIHESRLAAGGAPDNDDVFSLQDGRADNVRDFRADDTLVEIFGELYDSRCFLAQGEGCTWPYNGRKCPLKTRAIQWKAAFNHRMAGIHCLVQGTGHKGQDQFALGQGERADTLLILAVPLDPKSAIRIEHDLNDTLIPQGIHNQWPAVVFKAFQQTLIHDAPSPG